MRSAMATTIVIVAVCVQGPSVARGAETGDFDGDGRLTIADVVQAQESAEFAPGSLDGFEGTCATSRDCFLAGTVYVEILRRAVQDPMPHWYPLWDDPPPPSQPLPVSDRVTLEWVDSFQFAADRWRFDFDLTVREQPVLAFSVFLESDADILRPPTETRRPSAQEWHSIHAFDYWYEHFPAGDVPVHVSPVAYFATRGRYVASRGLSQCFGPFDTPLAPGRHRLSLTTRLGQGTTPGQYLVRALETSQFLLPDRSVVGPVIHGEGLIDLRAAIEPSLYDGIPPLDVDATTKDVLGKVEFRVTPVAGFPGAVVQPRIQMRTEVPLTDIRVTLAWPEGLLECMDTEPPVLFRDPETGELYKEWRIDGARGLWCASRGRLSGPNATFWFSIQHSYPDAFAQYFKPLGQWVDLGEVPLRILNTATGGTRIPMHLTAQSPSLVPESRPYGVRDLCDQRGFRYDVEYHDGGIDVLGDAEPEEPPPPPDRGFRWLLTEEVRGYRNDVVDIPMYAAVDEDTLTSYLGVFHFDPSALEVEEVVLFVESDRDRRIVPVVLRRGEGGGFRDCDDPDDWESCFGGRPSWYLFHGADSFPQEDHVVIDISRGRSGYLTGELRHIGSLRARLREDFEGPLTRITPSSVGATIDELGAMVTTGGSERGPDGLRLFVPATETRGALVRFEREFRRGDATGDGAVDIADPIRLLNSLFLGQGPLPCDDAADVNDDEALSLTDAIVLLQALFLGALPPAPPFPDCGRDSGTSLGCPESPCRTE